MHSAYVKVCMYTYTWELVQCRTGPLELSVAAFFSRRVLNCFQRRAIQMCWCFVVVVVVVCVGFFPGFFLVCFLLAPNGLYSTCSEAHGEMKIVLTLKTCLCNAAE